MIDITKEDEKFKCFLTEEAKSVLKTVEDKEIVVIAVAGP